MGKGRRYVSGWAAAVSVLAAAAGATAWQAASAATGLLIGAVILAEGVALLGVGAWLHRRQARRRDAREQARWERLAPLPDHWSVPDYPPPNLNGRDC